MITKGFNMGFFGRGFFNSEARNKFREEWSKMTDSEKIDFMDKKMAAFDEHHEKKFSVEHIDAHCEEWMKKTQEEKEEFVKKMKDSFNERRNGMQHFFGHEKFGF